MNQDLLHKYFKGETSVDEEKRILNWVDESEENRKTLQKERMLFDIALFTDSKRKMRESRRGRSHHSHVKVECPYSCCCNCSCQLWISD